MNEFKFRLYSLIHIITKRLLNKYSPGNINTIFKIVKFTNNNASSCDWFSFIEKSSIGSPPSFHGLHFSGFILEKQAWCLESWIWTNAAIVRLFSKNHRIKEASEIAYKLLEKQQKCGGWIVRNDYDSKGVIPVLAPNDSAYIANNAMLSLFKITNDPRLLTSACCCADWIMKTCREDGMVYTGFNTRDNVWNKNYIIVDVGFTGALFANLYEITKNEQYKDYLLKFTRRYIELFYLEENKGFATSIDFRNIHRGGMFARGQAWALEGLIPAYYVSKESFIKDIISKTIETLIRKQNNDGSWAYNLSRPLMGNDCKGVSVIANSLLEWNKIFPDKRLVYTAKKALNWCKKHTFKEGDAKGGIFSFCTEGAIVKDLYTSCAFVYASAYAIEVEQLLNKSNV